MSSFYPWLFLKLPHYILANILKFKKKKAYVISKTLISNIWDKGYLTCTTNNSHLSLRFRGQKFKVRCQLTDVWYNFLLSSQMEAGLFSRTSCDRGGEGPLLWSDLQSHKSHSELCPHWFTSQRTCIHIPGLLSIKRFTEITESRFMCKITRRHHSTQVNSDHDSLTSYSKVS